jgi:hypothetical protein
MRVGRWIGRIGVVSLPAVEVALGLDQRVVRRHVAKLEAAGWLARMPWVWGEGSVAWLTGAGMECIGLGGVRAIKAPPATTTTAHAVLVGWSAARCERRGRVWKSARELAVDRERWAVPARCERGYTDQLPDLAVWFPIWDRPGAVIAESGGRREDRQRMILEGWRDAIWSGRYTAMRYDCSSESVARWITRLAKKVGLTGSEFIAAVQADAAQIAALSPAAEPDAPEPIAPLADVVAVPITAEVADVSRQPMIAASDGSTSTEPPRDARPEPESPEAAAERARRYREIFGIPEPNPRRRWRH